MTLKKFNAEEVAKFFPFWGISTIKEYVYKGHIPTRKVCGRRFYDEGELKELSDKMFRGEITVTRKGVIKNGTAN